MTSRARIFMRDGVEYVRDYIGRGMVTIRVDMLLGMARAAGVRHATVINALESHLVRYQIMMMIEQGKL